MANEIVLVPIGTMAMETLNIICEAITEEFDKPCRVGKEMNTPQFAFNPAREQYSADDVLERLDAGDAERVLGVASVDMYVPDLNFVFGLADPPRRRALIALPRLREAFYDRPENERLFHERAVKEAIHELGHTYHLRHCDDPNCVMHFSNTLRDTDEKSRTFCRECQGELP